MSAPTVEIRQRFERQLEQAYFDIFRDGVFVIGSQTVSETLARKAELESTNWAWLNCYGGFTARAGGPREWIRYVREQGWHFDPSISGIECSADDARVFFHGNIHEYSAAFRYLILDPGLAKEVIDLVAELTVKRYG